MIQFDIGETVICVLEVKNEAGRCQNLATPPTITILDATSNVQVDNAAMQLDNIDVQLATPGKYHYDYQTEGQSGGIYEVKYVVTDGSRITIKKESFILS